MLLTFRAGGPGADYAAAVPRDEYLDYLAAVPLFSNLNKGQLRQIGKVADELTVQAGTVVARQGDVGRELLLILEGTAEVERNNEPIARLGRGDFVGEMAVLTHSPRNATVTATSDLVVLVVTATGLSQLLDDIPGLAKHLLYEVAARFAPTVSDLRG
jgi:CRP/FNR family transcriptional regulator, cyclic AMP receptor protein